MWFGVAGIAILLTGCGTLGGAGSGRLRSHASGSILPLKLPTRVYSSEDANSANFYLTDLPPEVWNAGADVSDMSGVLVHVHMFVRPRAGRTPIDDTATTAVVRMMVLAKGEIGVYGGGGFFVNSGDPGDRKFDGGLRGGTMRLISATGGFNDRLGPCTFSGEISGSKDQNTAVALDRAMRVLVAETTPIE